MKFDLAAKIGGVLVGLFNSIEVKLSFHKSADVPLEWCQGRVRFHKKGVIHVHHWRIDTYEYK